MVRSVTFQFLFPSFPKWIHVVNASRIKKFHQTSRVQSCECLYAVIFFCKESTICCKEKNILAPIAQPDPVVLLSCHRDFDEGKKRKKNTTENTVVINVLETQPYIFT